MFVFQPSAIVILQHPEWVFWVWLPPILDKGWRSKAFAKCRLYHALRLVYGIICDLLNARRIA
jgi:hypothetical protein